MYFILYTLKQRCFYQSEKAAECSIAATAFRTTRTSRGNRSAQGRTLWCPTFPVGTDSPPIPETRDLCFLSWMDSYPQSSTAFSHGIFPKHSSDWENLSLWSQIFHLTVNHNSFISRSMEFSRYSIEVWFLCR